MLSQHATPMHGQHDATPQVRRSAGILRWEKEQGLGSAPMKVLRIRYG